MPSEIIWSPTALDHLQAIYDYIFADNPVAALDVHEAIERTVGLLQETPRLGHPGRVADTRELVVPAYSELTPCNRNTSYQAALRVFAICTFTLCSTWFVMTRNRSACCS
jgi:plasmid stabilization system protein ParE